MKVKIITLTLLSLTMLSAENYLINLNNKHYKNNIVIKELPDNSGESNTPEPPQTNERSLSLTFDDGNLTFPDFNLIKANGTITNNTYRINSLSTSANGLAYESTMNEGDKTFEVQFDVKALSIDSFPTMFTMGINNTMNVCIRWTRTSYGAYFFGDQELNSNVLVSGSSITNWNTLKVVGDIENNISRLYVNGNLKMEGNFPISTGDSVFFSLGGGHNGCVAGDNGFYGDFDNITASFN